MSITITEIGRIAAAAAAGAILCTDPKPVLVRSFHLPSGSSESLAEMFILSATNGSFLRGPTNSAKPGILLRHNYVTIAIHEVGDCLVEVWLERDQHDSEYTGVHLARAYNIIAKAMDQDTDFTPRAKRSQENGYVFLAKDASEFLDVIACFGPRFTPFKDKLSRMKFPMYMVTGDSETLEHITTFSPFASSES